MVGNNQTESCEYRSAEPRRNFLRLAASLTVGAALDSTFGVPSPGESDVEPLSGMWEPLAPLRQGVFSVAIGNQIMHAPSATGQPERSTFLLRHLQALSPPVLRLPGGDMLNTWSWNSGRGIDALDAHRMRVEDFLTLCRAGHSVPLWGINAAGAAPSDTEFLAHSLVRQGADPQFFELGNELYLQRWRHLVGNADAYVQKAVPHGRLLKSFFPRAKCGVPLASYRQLTSTEDLGRFKGKTLPAFAWNTPDELDPWMLGLARQQDFFDAVVLHLYLVPTELGEHGLADHTAGEVCRWAWIRSDAQQVRDLFGLVHQVFPDKEIWVTEWAFNTSQYIGRGRNNDLRYQAHQTMLAVLYNARFLLNTAYFVPYVPITTYWTLYGQSTVDLLDQHRTTINYEMFRLLRWARQGHDELSRLQLARVPVLHGPPGPQRFDRAQSDAVDVFGFYHNHQLQALVILNALEHPISVDVPNLPANGFHDGRTLYAKELLPDWGSPDNPSFENWHPPYTLRKLTARNKIIRVPGNSLSVLHVNKSFG